MVQQDPLLDELPAAPPSEEGAAFDPVAFEAAFQGAPVEEAPQDPIEEPSFDADAFEAAFNSLGNLAGGEMVQGALYEDAVSAYAREGEPPAPTAEGWFADRQKALKDQLGDPLLQYGEEGLAEITDEGVPVVDLGEMKIGPTTAKEWSEKRKAALAKESGDVLFQSGYTADGIPIEDLGELNLSGPMHSQNEQRDAFLLELVDPDLSSRAKDEVVFDYVNNLFVEARGRLFDRPHNNRLRAESQERLRRSAEAIHESQRERYKDLDQPEDIPTVQEIYEALIAEKTIGNTFDPHIAEPEDYAQSVLQEELLSADLPAELKTKIQNVLTAKFRDFEPSIMESMLYNVSGIPLGHSVSGDVTKVIGGTANFPGALIAMTGGSVVAPFTSEKYFIDKERPLSGMESAVKSMGQVDQLVNRRIADKEFVDPGVMVGPLLEGQMPDQIDGYFSAAVEVSLRGKRLDADEGVATVPFYSPTDVFNITNNIADNADYIKRKIGDLLIADPSSAFNAKEIRGDHFWRDDTHADFEPRRLTRQEDKFIRESENFKKEVNRLFQRFMSANFADKDTIEEFPEEDQKYIEAFKEFFPEETANSKAFEVINKAADAVFSRATLREFIPEFRMDEILGTEDEDSIVGDLITGAYEGYSTVAEATKVGGAGIIVEAGHPELKELLSLVPKEDRKEVFQKLFGDEAFEYTQAAFTGGIPELFATKRETFRSLVGRYLTMKNKEATTRLARTGGLGSQWEGKHLESDASREIFHDAVPMLLTIQQLQRTPEFQESAETFYGTLGEGIASMPHEIHISAVGIMDYMGYGDVFSDELREAGRKKFEDDPALALADMGMLGALVRGGIAGGTIRGAGIYDAMRSVARANNGSLIPMIQDFAKQYSKSVTTAKKVIAEAAIKPVDEGTQANLTMAESGPALELDVQPLESSSNSIAGYRRRIAELDKELQKTDLDDATKEKLRLEREQNQRLAAVNKDFMEGQLEVEVPIDPDVAEGSITVKPSFESPTHRRAVDAALDDYAFEPETFSTQTSNQRVAHIQGRVKTLLDGLEGLYKIDQQEWLKNKQESTTVLRETAKGYRIENYRSMRDFHKMVKALKDSKIDNPLVWKELFEQGPFGKVSNKVIAEYVAEIKNQKYKESVAAKAKAIQRIDPPDSPIKVLSQETRKNPRDIKNSYDAAAIAENMAKNGDNNAAHYVGFGFSRETISGLLKMAEDSISKPAAMQKMQDIAGDRFDAGGPFAMNVKIPGQVEGILKEADPTTVHQTPTNIKGLETDTGWAAFKKRGGRTATRIFLGDKGYNLLRIAEETGQKRYTAVAAAESLARPFAVFNFPDWFRMSMTEMAHQAWANNWKGPVSTMARRTAEFFVKPSRALGDEGYAAIMESQGNTAFDLWILDKQFRETLDEGFIQNEARVKKVLGESSKIEPGTSPLTRAQISDMLHIIHRNLDDVIIKDNRNPDGPGYKLSDIVEPVIDAKRKFSKEIDYLQKQADYLIKEQKKYGKKTIPDERINVIEQRILELEAKIESGDTVVNIHEVFPDDHMLRRAYDEVKNTDPGQAAILKDQIDINAQFTPRAVRNLVDGFEYRAKRDVALMDDFEQSVLIVAQEAAKPRAAKLFDLIFQAAVSNDSARIMFRAPEGRQNIVARTKTTPEGKVQYEVLRTFPDTPEGELAARAFKQKTATPASDVKPVQRTKKGTKERDKGLELEQIEGKGSAAQSSEAVLGDIVAISKQELENSVYDNASTLLGPQPAKAAKVFDVSGADILKQSLTYMSHYFEDVKIASYLNDLLQDVANNKISKSQADLLFQDTARKIMSGYEGGLKLVEKHGPAKALEMVLKMNDADIKTYFGDAGLSKSEQFFLKQAYASKKEGFNSADLVTMLSDYNMSFFRTAVDLTNNINRNQLVTKMRKDGKFLTEAEKNRLSPQAQKQYVEVESVTSKPDKTSQVFPSSMSGGWVAKTHAEFFARQKGLQLSQQLAFNGPWKALQSSLQTVSQVTKLNLLLDFVNNALLRNAMSGVGTMAFGHGNHVLDPRYLAKTGKYIRDIEKGIIPDDPVFMKAFRTYMSGSSSLKGEFWATNKGRYVRDLFLDYGDYMSTRRMDLQFNNVKGPKSEQAIRALADTLELKGFEKQTAKFFDGLRTHNLEGPIESNNILKRSGSRFWNKLGVAREKFLNVYGFPDSALKTAYHWQLMDKHKYKPAAALRDAMQTFVDYPDLSAFFNAIRFGGAGGIATSALIGEFIGFSANQVPNHFRLLTAKPYRAFMLGQLSRTYDEAVNETLKFGFTIQELRNLYRDPTLQLMPYYTGIERSTGLERGIQTPFQPPGPRTYSGATISGVPGHFSVPMFEKNEESLFGYDMNLTGFPIFPMAPASVQFGTPKSHKDVVPEDYLALINNLTREYGGFVQQSGESAGMRQTAAKQDLEDWQKFAETYDNPEELQRLKSSLKSNATISLIERKLGRPGIQIYNRIVPRIFRSAQQFISGMTEEPFGIPGFPKERKGYTSALGGLLGFSGGAINVNTILPSTLIPAGKVAKLNRSLERFRELRDAGGTFTPQQASDYYDAQEALKELQEIVARDSDKLSDVQRQQMDDLEVAAFAYMLQAKMTEKDLKELLEATSTVK